ncbi:MAG TPA: hypothetical protein VGI10_02155 [Polyangiaceae bacterium]|jgi:uncharacterized membrane protein
MAPTQSVSESLARARAEVAELASKIEQIGIETRTLTRGTGADRMVAVGVACNAQRVAIVALQLAAAAATALAVAPEVAT